MERIKDEKTKKMAYLFGNKKKKRRYSMIGRLIRYTIIFSICMIDRMSQKYSTKIKYHT